MNGPATFGGPVALVGVAFVLPSFLMVLALAVLLRVKRMPEPLLMAGAGALGVMLMGPPSTVVFVCEHGSAKSLVAASLFDRLAKERGLHVRAVSRGTAPDAAVPPAVARALADEGVDVSAFRPRALGEADLRGATLVVAFGVDVGDMARKAGVRVSRWDDVPAVSTSYAEARAAIVSRLATLLDDLEVGR
ncbi:MAG TPA: hypothetical protein VFM88_22870 [Vicinamibacteria bacterium]|nr:hypothetical protein [Vicinamibacteria bacterium]